MKIAILASKRARFGVIAMLVAIAGCSQESAAPAGDAPESSAAVSGSIRSAPGTDGGSWGYLGGDAAHTRYSPVDDINLENFEGRVAADLLRQFAPVALAGSFSVQVGELQVRNGRPVEGAGRVVWQNAAFDQDGNTVADQAWIELVTILI